MSSAQETEEVPETKAEDFTPTLETGPVETSAEATPVDLRDDEGIAEDDGKEPTVVTGCFNMTTGKKTGHKSEKTCVTAGNMWTKADDTYVVPAVE